jgi:hypothetical protein
MSDNTEQPDDAVTLTDEAVMAKWAEIAPWIDRVAVRIQDANDFVVHAGSALALDDRVSHPYCVSHCARACLNAGVDHLHALKRLVIDNRILHADADYSLSRGALENFGAAFWVLHPAEPTARITCALRWMAQNFKDQAKAIEGLDMDNVPSREANLAKVQRVADAAGCGQVTQGYSSTAVMRYAKLHSSTEPFLPWQVCSGFAHGRPSANLDGRRHHEKFLTKKLARVERKAAKAAAKRQPATTQRGAPDLLDQLTKLAGLRDAGVLTEEELQAKKTEILGRM